MREFDQDREAGHAVLYQVGESSAAKDWPAYQPGSFDSIVGRSTMQHDWTEVHPTPSRTLQGAVQSCCFA